MQPGEPQAGGSHWRFVTGRGPLHVWLPRDYDPVTAGVVVYVHGLFVTVDGAWAEHALAEQFAESRKNALFVAPEAPRTGDEQPAWDSLAALLDQVTSLLAAAGELAPQVPDIVVLGHSGAYRTLTPWLTDPIRHLFLVDALYGNEDDFAAWIEGSRPAVDGRPTRQLTIVADDTYRWTEPFVRRYHDVVLRVGVPERGQGFTNAEKRARILYVPSQHRHLALVAEGRALPPLLGQTALLDVRPLSPRRRARR